MEITINDAHTRAVLEISFADRLNHSTAEIARKCELAISALVSDGGGNRPLQDSDRLVLVLTSQVLAHGETLKSNK